MAFSSASSRTELSQSKMPPQQSQGLLDLSDEFLNFVAHVESVSCEPLNRGPWLAASTHRLERAGLADLQCWPVVQSALHQDFQEP